MKVGVITNREFQAGITRPAQKYGTHPYQARLVGKAIEVRNGEQIVDVTYGGTRDNRTVYAHVDGEGFIGGWRYPHRAQGFARLIESINEGRLYRAMADLPNGRKGSRT